MAANIDEIFSLQSLLPYHKFRHGFGYICSPICPCNTEIESNEHFSAQKMKKSLMENFIFCAVFLLRCHFHSSQRLELFDNLDKVNPSFFNLSAKDQGNILLSSYSANNSISLSQGIIKLVINFLIKYVCFDRQLRKQ